MAHIQYYEASFEEHANAKSMWIGGPELETHQVCLIKRDDTVINNSIEISTKAMKVFDELITNAFDHRIKCGDLPLDQGGPVTEINVNFNGDTITVTNNGPGFRIHRMEKSGLWSVESLCTRQFAGSNTGKEVDPYRVVGGQNGLGLKLIILASTQTTVTTVCAISGLYYQQTFTASGDNLVRSDPTVLPIANRPDGLTHCYTKFTMELNYHKIFAGWKGKTTAEKNELRRNYAYYIGNRLNDLYMFGTTMQYTTGRDGPVHLGRIPLTVTYNDFAFTRSVPETMNALYGDALISEVQLVAFDDDMLHRFPWYNYVAVRRPGAAGKAARSLSVVNNITMPENSTFTTWFLKELTEAIWDIIRKKKGEAERLTNHNVNVTKYLVVWEFKFSPLASFKGQTKDKVIVDAKSWNQEKVQYDLSRYTPQIKQLADAIREAALADIAVSKTGPSKQPRMRMNHLHTPAIRMRQGNSRLVVCEGNSAESTVVKIFRQTPREVSERVGYFTLRGVPLNIAKSSTKVVVDGEESLLTSEKFDDNIVFRCLLDATGLDRNAKYYMAPTKNPTPKQLAKQAQGDKEFAKLNYGKIIIATDQDQDGAQITGLILNLVYTVWPHLFARGYVGKYITPLLRLRDSQNKRVLRFYTDAELQKYIQNTYGGVQPKYVKINRYKGLGGHSEADIKNDMSRCYAQDMFRFHWDPPARQMLQDIYGKTTAKRKILFRQANIVQFNQVLYRKQILLASEYLCGDVLSFHLYNISRKLPSIYDGLNIVQRKILTVCRRFRKATTKISVVALSGKITSDMGYHHGDASAIDSITYMAQSFLGSNSLPALIAYSAGVGSIISGRGDVAQARYLSVGYNARLMDLMFPPEDDPLLRWHCDGKETLEPHSYIGILPHSLLQNSTSPSSGWKVDVWGRHISPVMTNVRLLIAADTTTYQDFIDGTDALKFAPSCKLSDLLGKLWLPSLNTFGDKEPQIHRDRTPVLQTFIRANGKMSERSVGKFLIKGDTITITALPYRHWLNTIRESISKKDKADNPTHILVANDILVAINNTSTDEINLRYEIVLREGGIEWIRRTALIADKLDNPYYIDPTQPPASPASPASAEDITLYNRIISVLGLYNDITMELNFTDENGVIMEFNSFQDMQLTWYIRRRNLYMERIARGSAIMRARLTMLANKLRYIRANDAKVMYPAYSGDYRTVPEYLEIMAGIPEATDQTVFNINNRISKEQRYAILLQHGFARIDTGLLANVGSITWNAIYTSIVDSTTSKYKYIDDIRTKDYDSDKVAALRTEIQTTYEHLIDLTTNDWKHTWLKELAAITTVIREGIQTKWQAENLDDYVWE